MRSLVNYTLPLLPPPSPTRIPLKEKEFEPEQEEDNSAFVPNKKRSSSPQIQYLVVKSGSRRFAK